MDERKKFFLTVVVGLVALLFLSTHLFLPIAKDNTRRAVRYKQLKIEVKTIEKFSGDDLDFFQDMIEAATSDLEKMIPRDGKLRLTEQLTRVPVDSNAVFTEITHKKLRDKGAYQVFPVDVNMKVSFYDLVKYLLETETNPLIVGIDSLRLRRVEPNAEFLDVKITFSGFKITGGLIPMSKYLKERYDPLDKQRLERLLEPVGVRDGESAGLKLKDYDPFVYLYDFKIPVTERIVRSEPEVLMVNNIPLSLKGILRIADKKVALINDNIVKVGEKIAGIEIIEIQADLVVLIYSGKRYILKMEEVDGLIKH